MARNRAHALDHDKIFSRLGDIRYHGLYAALGRILGVDRRVARNRVRDEVLRRDKEAPALHEMVQLMDQRDAEIAQGLRARAKQHGARR